MFNKINRVLKEMEDIEQEIKIILNMHKLTLIEYVMIKRGSLDYPSHLQVWMLEQIDNEINKLKSKIEELNKIKKEYLVW